MLRGEDSAGDDHEADGGHAIPEDPSAATTPSEADAPPGWSNWIRAREGARQREAWEFAFYSDETFSAEAREGLGPYQLLNPVPDRPDLAASVVMRVRSHLPEPPGNLVWERTGLDEEIASLLSLALGRRCRSGGHTRWFRQEEGADPLGEPISWEQDRPILPRPGRSGPLLPRSRQQASLVDVVPLLSLYPQLRQVQAEALARSSRAYADALWIADGDPEQAWLKLVSAVEAAAGEWRPGDADPVEVLRAARPKLARHLREVGGESHLRAVAAEIAHLFQATAKFLAFLKTFAPPPPAERPEPWLRVNWARLNRQFDAIYEARSKALHEAQPLPGYMLRPPLTPTTGGPPAEGWPFGGGQACMQLHVFTYVVGAALRSWWAQLSDVDGRPSGRGPSRPSDES